MVELPRVMLICDYQFCRSSTRWCEVLRTISNRDWNRELAVQIRIKNQSDTQYRELAELARSILPPTVRTLLNGDAQVAAELGYDGVHLPQDCFKTHATCTEKLGWVSLAIHEKAELSYVDSLGAHSIVVAPIFRPDWKVIAPLGLSRLRTLVSQSSVPVYALGGINHTNIEVCRQQHVHGIAVLSSVLQARDPIAVLKQYLSVFDNRRISSNSGSDLDKDQSIFK